MANTKNYKGDPADLPLCPKCEKGEGENHKLMTYDHPYEMVEEVEGGDK